MERELTDDHLDVIFRQARSYNRWQDREVSDDLLRQVYDLMKWGPTSANCSPARFVFIKSAQAKERLKPHMSEGNVVKIMTAPVTVIIGTDSRFYEKLPELFPHEPTASSWFTSNPAHTAENAFRNGTLQGAYFMIAARALGLDCGPMSGFDPAGVNEEFFPDGRIEANFLLALGYGSDELLFPRSPRLSFSDAADIL